MIVCVVGEKGGTGKTTIATGLSACVAGDGFDTLLVDSDTQLTASKWQAIRNENESLARVNCVSLFGRSLAKEVRNLAHRYEQIIIDTGGRDTFEMRAALTVAQLALVPFSPSQFDLWTAEKMYQMFEEASAVNPELKVLAVISKAEANLTTLDYLAAEKFLKDFDGVTLASKPIRTRVAFKRASQEGMNVIEYENNRLSKSTIELGRLYTDIYGKKQRRGRGY